MADIDMIRVAAAAFSGAVCGGIGAGVGAVAASAVRKRRWSPRIATLSLAVCVAVGVSLSTFMTPVIAAQIGTTQEAGAAQGMADLERQVPAFAALRMHEPEAYERLRNTIANGLARNTPYDQLVNEARASISAVYMRKLPHMKDELVLATAALVEEQGRILAKASPDTCVAWLNGRGGNLEPYLPKAVVQKEFALLESVIRSAPQNAVVTATDDQLAAHAPALLDAVAARTGLPSDIAAKALNGEGTSTAVCLAQSGLMGAIADLPAGQGAAILRLIYSQDQTAS